MDLKELKKMIRRGFYEYGKDQNITPEFIKNVADKAGIDIFGYDMNELIKGYKIELEHGTIDAETNVTDDDPVKTLKITLAHLNEIPDYNTRLDAMEKNAKKEMVQEVSKSKSQQRLMGWAKACKDGEADFCPKNIQDIADSMSDDELDDFASTKHKGLPEKVNESFKYLAPEAKNNKLFIPKHRFRLKKSDPLIEKKNFIKDFIIACCDEANIKDPIDLTLTTRRGGPITTTASFNPNNNKIFIYSKDRHVIDVLRSIAHEIKHWHQNIQGVLHDGSGLDGSEHENEAHAFSGLMIRKFGKMCPKVYE